ncbi:MAG: hypothetical protein R3F02_19600 [Thiolinea sp.]
MGSRIKGHSLTGFVHGDVFGDFRRCFVIAVTRLIGGEGTGTCRQQGNGVAVGSTRFCRIAAQTTSLPESPP